MEVGFLQGVGAKSPLPPVQLELKNTLQKIGLNIICIPLILPNYSSTLPASDVMILPFPVNNIKYNIALTTDMINFPQY